jgi:acetyl esterase/lipase
MKTKIIGIAVLVVCSVLALGIGKRQKAESFTPATTQAAQKAEITIQGGVWEIGPRTLPAPVDVSDAFRESLLNTPAPDVKATRSQVPETIEQWEAMIRTLDEKMATTARKLAHSLSVKVQRNTIAGVNVYRVTPPEVAPEHKSHLFFHVHGGAYILNGGEAGTFEAVLIANHLKIPVVSIDYRMPPKHPAPAAMEDVVAVWKELLTKMPPTSMAMGGTSAGAGLTMASVQRFKELGLSLPRALLLGTPGADAGKVGDSRYINEGIDTGLVTWDGLVDGAIRMYVANYDLKHPYVSPVYGDFKGFPPSYLISGTRDLMLSDTVRVHRKLRRAGVEADLHVYEGQSHADYLKIMNAPESYEHFAELNAFLLKHLQSPLPAVSPLPADISKDIDIPKSAGY